jgi:hypothetical protein
MARELLSLRTQLAEARKAATWVPIDEEHVPKTGDVIWGEKTGRVVLTKYRGINLVETTYTAEELTSEGWTLYFPITAPQEEKKAHE